MADDAPQGSFVLEIPEMVGIALSPQRKPQAATRPWPAGTVIVSADSHMLEGDYWYDRFPEDLREQAPRMAFKDGGYHLSVAGREMTPPALAAALCTSLECTPGMTSIDARLADLDIEGVEKELIFPQRLFGLFMFGKMMNRAETFGAYNEAIAEACAAGKGRLFPVMVPNYWDPALARESVARCKALGAHCLMIPIKPGDDVDGEPIQYSNPKLDPFWDAVAASGIPLCFHIGEAIPTAAPGAAVGIASPMWKQSGMPLSATASQKGSSLGLEYWIGSPSTSSPGLIGTIRQWAPSSLQRSTDCLASAGSQ